MRSFLYITTPPPKKNAEPWITGLHFTGNPLSMCSQSRGEDADVKKKKKRAGWIFVKRRGKNSQGSSGNNKEARALEGVEER